jgi:hypothetical protein
MIISVSTCDEGLVFLDSIAIVTRHYAGAGQSSQPADMACFGSKATSGLCQPIIAMMPPHDTYSRPTCFVPDRLHWASYAGRNFTDRQRIKRKAANWGRRYHALPRAERVAVLAAMMAAEAGDIP